MSLIEDQLFFRLNRWLFLTIGAWYSQTSVFALCYRIICYSIMLSFTIAQLLTFTKLNYNMDSVTDVLSVASVTICIEAEYYTIVMKREIVKDILIRLERIFDEVKDKNEIAIFQKYGEIAGYYTILFIVIFLTGIVCLTAGQFWSIILDVVLPLNESRPHHLLIEVEYFVDQEKYFYLITLHINLAYCVGGMVATSAGSLLITYYQIICGILKIASYRIEHVMRSDVLRNIKKNEDLIYNGLTYAVYIHRKATESTEFVTSTFEIILLFFFAVIGFVTSLNMFRILQIMLQLNNIENLVNLMIPAGIIFLIFMYFFAISYVGQQIIDNNNNIFVTAYNVRWYKTPLHVQRLILFLLQRGGKIFAVNIRGLVMLSLEAFAALVSTTISYFTVFYSIE